MRQLRGPADAGIEAVAGIEAAVVVDERRLCLIEVAYIVLGGILRAARVQQFPHTMLDFRRVVSLADNIILVEYVTEEMPIIELMSDRTRDILWQGFEKSGSFRRSRCLS